jgi:TonB family protein
MAGGKIRMKAYLYTVGLLLALAPLAWSSSFVPPQNLNPGSSTIALDNSYNDEAWLVYTYDIEASGQVANATIHSSNGVTAVEQAILQQVSSLQFKPATRNNKPVKVSADPIFFTWILDKPRAMSAEFDETYQAAWAEFKQKEYDKAFDLAVKLKAFPGHNAFEEVKFQVLAASLASRWEDGAAELQHLSRAVELQVLADKNDFIHPYIEPGQLLMIVERIHTLQINSMMLADADKTLSQIQGLGAGSEVAVRSGNRQMDAEQRFRAQADVVVAAELTPIYREGPGSWKTGLSRNNFSISNASLLALIMHGGVLVPMGYFEFGF